MLDLEQAIGEWRKQMIAGGVQTPVPLEELESHLRDEIAQLTRSGSDASGAFQQAIEKIGSARALNHEFSKNPGLHRFSFRRFATIPGVLAILWFVGCAHDLMITVCWWYVSPQGVPHFNLPHGLMNILINGAGCAGSLLLFVGSKLGVHILRSVALVYLIICLTQCLLNLGQTTDWRIWCGFFAAFSLLSIWLLHRPLKQTATA